MTRQEALELQAGQSVEVRYIGRGAGRVYKGTVHSIWPDGSHIVVEYTGPPYGIDWSIPCEIVHVVISPEFQAMLDRLLPGKQEEK